MNGYIVLIVFTVFVFSCFFSFIGGLIFGRKQAKAEYTEELQMKARLDKDAEKVRAEIAKRPGNQKARG